MALEIIASVARITDYTKPVGAGRNGIGVHFRDDTFRGISVERAASEIASTCLALIDAAGNIGVDRDEILEALSIGLQRNWGKIIVTVPTEDE